MTFVRKVAEKKLNYLREQEEDGVLVGIGKYYHHGARTSTVDQFSISSVPVRNQCDI